MSTRNSPFFDGARWLAIAAIVIGVGCVDGSSCQGEELRIAVVSNQWVTIVGSAPSLRALLEELCWQAHVALRYDAPDAPVSAAIEGERFDVAIGRLLRDRSYVLTTRRVGGSLVTVLEVLSSGPYTPSGAPPTGNGTRGRVRIENVHLEPGARSPMGRQDVPFSIPERVLFDLFGGHGDVGKREAAVRELVQSIKADPARQAAFLGADVGVMRRTLARYPTAASTLRQIADSAGLGDREREKLEALIASLQ
jgi:hypothetical protein